MNEIKISKIKEPNYKFLYEDAKQKLDYAMECLLQDRKALLDIKEYIEGLKGDYDYELQNCVEEKIFNIINKALNN